MSTGDKVKDVFKRGWHPEKAGTTLKGQMKSLVGRGDDKTQNTHVARPLSSLRNPAEFAPPPQRRSDTIGSSYSGSGSTPTHPPAEAEPEAEEPPQPPKPWRLNTTGLSTDGLPPPPGRRDGADGRGILPPPSLSSTTSRGAPPPPPARPSSGTATPPSLPPRLPPRSNSSSPAPAAPAISTITSASGASLNQSAISRLGAAGINIPALGIGSSTTSSRPAPPPPSYSSATSSRPAPPPPSSSSSSAVSELQSRFARLKSTSQPQTAAQPEPPSEGTSWAQKKQTLKTVSDLHKDPSKVSFSDMKAAASTADNFRQRHGEQVAKTGQVAGGLYEKYGTPPPANRQQESTAGSGQGGIGGVVTSVLAKKKPPPPPPPKKKNLSIGGGFGTGEDAPPPVPMGTRPQF
ncbi:hypothetical protein QBC43DRAFT_307433 [Cladorrhinum sp. PSN259]|nr:hypothetical protein QBC43DRAFT_307433 [Cladorrhinum sp. PSN259]